VRERTECIGLDAAVYKAAPGGDERGTQYVRRIFHSRLEGNSPDAMTFPWFITVNAVATTRTVTSDCRRRDSRRRHRGISHDSHDARASGGSGTSFYAACTPAATRA
jgi:hypothetical protein